MTLKCSECRMGDWRGERIYCRALHAEQTAWPPACVDKRRRSLSWLLVLMVLAALTLVALEVSAAAGTVSGTSGGYGNWSITAASSSCADVIAALNASAIRSWSGENFTTCSADPVVVGTTFPWSFTWLALPTVSVIEATAAGGDTGGGGGGTTPVASGGVAVCVASDVTESPCPAGFAPMRRADFVPWIDYAGTFGSVPVQDVVVGLAFVVLFGLGFPVGFKLLS